MKKRITKLTFVLSLAGILALNFNSNLQFEAGGEEVEAFRSERLCYEQTEFYSGGTVWECSTCSIIPNRHGFSGWENTCDPEIPYEN